MRQIAKWAVRQMQRIQHKPLPVDALHDYWRTLDGPAADNYLKIGEERSKFLVSLIDRHLPDGEASIFEVGCNAGRNLAHLHAAGYHDLHAVEISEDALARLRDQFPDMEAALHNGAVEDVLPELPDGAYDAVFSVAVLEHIHYDSDWVLADIARIARRFVITIEDEASRSGRHFARNYRKVFEELGLAEVERIEQPPDCPAGFVARVFRQALGPP